MTPFEQAQDTELRREIQMLLSEVAALEARALAAMGALEEFTRQVDEFEAGEWDGGDWPVAIDVLCKIRDASRAILPGTKP